MRQKAQPYYKAIFAFIGAFVAAFIVQGGVVILEQRIGYTVSPELQASALFNLESLIVSALIGLMTTASVYQAPANKS